MAAQERIASRQLPFESLSSDNREASVAGSQQVEQLDSQSSDIAVRVVYHRLRRPGVHIALPELRRTSTVEEVASLLNECLSNLANSPPCAPPLLPRLFYRGVELRSSQRTLEDYSISSGAVLAAAPGSPLKTLTVSQLVPCSGSETGGNSVHIHGRCFQTTAERPLLARFGSTIVQTTPVSSEAVRCTSPAHPPGGLIAMPTVPRTLPPFGSTPAFPLVEEHHNVASLLRGPVSVEVSSDGGHTWTSNNVVYTYIGLRTVLDQPIRVPSVHCSAMSTVQELERAALRHSRGF